MVDSKKTKKTIAKSFLETLKEVGSDVAKTSVNDVAGGIAKDSLNQLFGWSAGSGEEKQGTDFEGFSAEKQKEKIQWSNQEFTSIAREEAVIFKQEEQNIKIKIEAIREEIKKLVIAAGSLAKEAEIATVQAPVNPGVYHVNLLERIREFLVLLRKKVVESGNWLAMANKRTNKRGFYWAQVRKSGTKFMLSSERYVATQAG